MTHLESPDRRFVEVRKVEGDESVVNRLIREGWQVIEAYPRRYRTGLWQKSVTVYVLGKRTNVGTHTEVPLMPQGMCM